ncbi:hypothetical protein OK016_21250 [Vibrio chagasii]|nr:hypothetical protein [Vibrio chagasii]
MSDNTAANIVLGGIDGPTLNSVPAFY